MYRLAVFLTVLTLAACEPASQGDVDTAPPTDTTSHETVVDTTTTSDGDDASDPNGQAALGVSLQTLLDGVHSRDGEGHVTVLDRLNEPNRVETSTEENRHNPGQVDTVKTRHYAGASVTVYHVATGKEIVRNVVITGDQYETGDGLHVGMSRSELENAWGQPTSREGTTYVYELEGEMPPHARYAFNGDTVRRIEWQYSID